MENGGEVDSSSSSNNVDENAIKQVETAVMDSDEKSSSDDMASNEITPEPNVEKSSIESTQTGSEKEEENVEAVEEEEDAGVINEVMTKEDETKENGVVDKVNKVETPEDKRSPPPEKMEDETAENTFSKEEEEVCTDENEKKNPTDNIDVEDQQSSTLSSISALHIHLDDEDTDESLNGNKMCSNSSSYRWPCSRWRFPIYHL